MIATNIGFLIKNTYYISLEKSQYWDNYQYKFLQEICNDLRNTARRLLFNKEKFCKKTGLTALPLIDFKINLNFYYRDSLPLRLDSQSDFDGRCFGEIITRNLDETFSYGILMKDYILMCIANVTINAMTNHFRQKLVLICNLIIIINH